MKNENKFSLGVLLNNGELKKILAGDGEGGNGSDTGGNNTGGTSGGGSGTVPPIG